MKMTSALTTLMLLTSLCFSSFVSAEDVAIPVVNKPAALQEGTQRELSADQVAELLPWAKNSKSLLGDMVNGLDGLSTTDKIERLELGIKSAVNESAPKNTELLMRYVLNRALVVNDILKVEMSEDSVGTSDTKLRVLLTSVNMAIKYYDLDEKVLSKKAVIPFAKFGQDYFIFLNELNKSIFDASASYAIQKTALQWLQWDLYRDLNNTSYAPQIVKLNNGLKLLPEKKLSDAQSLNYIRQMKLLASQLSLAEIKVDYPIMDATNLLKSNIRACQESFKSTTELDQCFTYARTYYIVPEVTQNCANVLSSESGRLACILNFKNLVSNPEAFSYIKTCANNFSSEEGKLNCMAFAVNTSIEVEVLNSCGYSFKGDKGRLYCIKQMVCKRSEASESAQKECFDRNLSEFTGIFNLKN